MKVWKMFSLWAGLSSSYANAVTFLGSHGEGVVDWKGFSDIYDMNNLLDGKCNVHGSILNDTQQISRNLLSIVRGLETKLQKDLDNGQKDSKLKAIWTLFSDNLLTPSENLGKLKEITFFVTENFPNGSYCLLTGSCM
eukprot:GHVS01100043.1.p1 GENE.GHVS01100043.1~~GHVS01100043.1.p1  ORF type:complete len:138 (+),score=5.64 GHVS01100043.1:360-773(+)